MFAALAGNRCYWCSTHSSPDTIKYNIPITEKCGRDPFKSDDILAIDCGDTACQVCQLSQFRIQC